MYLFFLNVVSIIVPFTVVDRVVWALFCLTAAPDCGSLTVASSLLPCVLRSSSCTLFWERLMKSGLDLCSASCQNQEHISALDKTFKANTTYPAHQNMALGHPKLQS